MTRSISFVLAHPKTLALLLSLMATGAWLGAVASRFDAVAQAQPRQIQLPTVTVVAKTTLLQAQPQQIQLPTVTVLAKQVPLPANDAINAVQVVNAAAAAGSKL